MTLNTRSLAIWTAVAGWAMSCAPTEATGLKLADPGSGAQVRFDLTVKPLPEIPYPNDFATRYDPASPTGLRVNASLIAPTEWEAATRASIDQLDGWSTYGPITVAFDQPLDVESIYAHHSDDYDFSDDVVYVINISPDSPDFCQAVPLDMGKGNFPLFNEKNSYYPDDPRAATNQLLYEEVEEDLNHNGVLDPGEDTDMDGVLDHPNVRTPGADPKDSLLTFYERESRTLILRPLMPLREESTYAVALMRTLKDESGRPVRSPFKYINHTQQTKALSPLPGCLSNYGRSIDDVAFTWSFTTQSITRDYVAIRDGLYGMGPMSWLADQYPPELTTLFDLKDAVPGQVTNLKIISEAEVEQVIKQLLPVATGAANNPAVAQALLDSRKFIAYHVVGQYVSPQFFPRAPAGADDSNPANWLPLYQQVWQVDAATGQAYQRPETITFWLSIPKPEYSQRPAPVAILGHGYTGTKLDPLLYGGFFARQGVATLGVECPSHGIDIDSPTRQLVEGIFNGYHIQPMIDALLHDRAFDQNGDGVKDSGADFWTSYPAHTRDMVRQSAVDYMRLVQILRSFDGSKKWSFDVNHSGQPGLAGDFDGDGQVDVGGAAQISFLGGSLGGIMGAVMGGLEPGISVIAPISGGAGLSDIGIRSKQGGVVEAVNLRILAPLFVTLPEPAGLGLWQILPNLNKEAQVRLGSVQDPLHLGDTVVLRNLRSAQWECAAVQAGGLVRASVSTDQGDPLQLEIYPGALPPDPDHGGCKVPEGTSPRTVINSFGADVSFQTRSFAAGTPLVALGDGFGLKRGTPAMRRFTGLAQLMLDPGDPINFAPNYEFRLLKYGTGERVRTRAMVMVSVGDQSVPVNTGAAIARAAGLIDFTNKDPRYNKTPNQVLIDTYSLEGAERAQRYVNGSGLSVLMDVEHLSNLTSTGDGWDVPRLDPPLRLVGPSTRLGGVRGTLFPMSTPQGQHGFNLPNPSLSFDTGGFLMTSLARFVSTGGAEYSFDPCQVDASCSWLPPIPPSY